VSDEHPSGSGSGRHDATGWIILGVVLIVAGFFLGARNLGIMPWPFGDAWNVISKARFGIGVVIIGIALIVWSQSGRHINMPRKGTRLYRSRTDKWLAGVLGGLANYFGVDPTILRLAFIGLVVLLDVGGLILVYIVMAIIVPYAPEEQAAAGVAPAWPEAPAAPAPPAAPPAPAVPAPGEEDAPPPAPPL
jgi:phage shock protein C